MPWRRPTVETPFQIDWEWWANNDRNYRLYLHEQLCEACRHRFPSPLAVDEVDWIDPVTAEVTRADALQMCLRTECAQDPDYITESLPVAAAVFRVFLVEGNRPMSPKELNKRLHWRSPDTILSVIGGRRVHYGIRPL